MTGESTKAKFITSGVLVHEKTQETEILVVTHHRAKKVNQSEDDNYASSGLKRALDNSLMKEAQNQSYIQTNQFLSERESIYEDN
jgi:hypothetical protein